MYILQTSESSFNKLPQDESHTSQHYDARRVWQLDNYHWHNNAGGGDGNAGRIDNTTNGLSVYDVCVGPSHRIPPDAAGIHSLSDWLIYAKTDQSIIGVIAQSAHTPPSEHTHARTHAQRTQTPNLTCCTETADSQFSVRARTHTRTSKPYW